MASIVDVRLEKSIEISILSMGEKAESDLGVSVWFGSAKLFD